MKAAITTFIFSFLIIHAQAEILEGNTGFMDTINGKPLFILYDGVEVTCTDFKEDWCIAAVEAIVDIKLLKDTGDWILPKGMKLINWKGKVVGEILSDYTFYLGYEGRDTTEQTVLVSGYIQRSKIRTNSIIENRLREVIGNKEQVTFQDLKKHIEEFRYQYDGQFQGLRTYAYYENIIETYAPVDRIRLAFKDNILIGIVHTRELAFPNTTAHPQPKYRFLFYNFADEKIKEKFISNYNRFFKTIEI